MYPLKMAKESLIYYLSQEMSLAKPAESPMRSDNDALSQLWTFTLSVWFAYSRLASRPHRVSWVWAFISCLPAWFSSPRFHPQILRPAWPPKLWCTLPDLCLPTDRRVLVWSFWSPTTVLDYPSVYLAANLEFCPAPNRAGFSPRIRARVLLTHIPRQKMSDWPFETRHVSRDHGSHSCVSLKRNLYYAELKSCGFNLSCRRGLLGGGVPPITLGH